jgi:signal transduction histidine kinase
MAETRRRGAGGGARSARSGTDADLLSRLVHDLKNSLGAVLSFAEMLSTAGEAERAEFGERIGINAHRSIQLLDEFALLNDLRQRRLECNATECDWFEVVDGAVEQLRPAMEDGLARVEWEGAAPVAIWADAWLLTRAMRCVLRAVLHATGEGARIHLVPRLCGASSELCLSAPATGGGQSREEPLIDDQDPEIELLRRVAALHGGSVSVSSRWHGIEVILRLPPAAASPAV